MNARALPLESFDESPHDLDETADGPPGSYQEGYAAGCADAEAAHRADQARLSGDLVQTFADMSFGYAEARLEIMAALRPLFTMMSQRMLPELAHATLVPHLVDLLAKAAAADTARPIRVTVHPLHVDALKTTLCEAGGFKAEVQGDPLLGDAEAIFTTPDGETALDLAEVATAAGTILSALFDAPQKRTRHE